VCRCCNSQPGELCAMQQSASSKIHESKLWNTKEQSGRGFNLAATSAPGHVTTALASVAPELDSTPINRLTDDKRSVVPTAQSRSVVVARRTQAPGCVTSAAVRANPGLDYSLTEDHIDNRQMRSVGLTAQCVALLLSTSHQWRTGPIGPWPVGPRCQPPLGPLCL